MEWGVAVGGLLRYGKMKCLEERRMKNEGGVWCKYAKREYTEVTRGVMVRVLGGDERGDSAQGRPDRPARKAQDKRIELEGRMSGV